MEVQPQDTAVMQEGTYQMVTILLTAISAILWALLQYNFSRFVKRQDNFSMAKDDHEKRLTHIETMIQNSVRQNDKRDLEVTKTFDRVEGNVNEIRQKIEKLTDMMYRYLLKDKDIE